MKKISLFLFIALLGISGQSFSQTTTTTAVPPVTSTMATDYFAGKWEITVTGLPDGDAKFVTDLVRKDGKLTGELKDPTGKRAEAIPVTKVEEEPGKKMTIFFDTAQAGEIALDLTKVDEDHLKGQMMSMFDATALRVKK